MNNNNQDFYSILRLKQVEARTGLSRSTIYSRIANGIFPKQFNLGTSRSVGWLESDINDWIKGQLQMDKLRIENEQYKK